MNKRILLGIDAHISAATHCALRAASDLMGQSSTDVNVVLLTVIPTLYTASPSLGMYVGHSLPVSITPEQRHQAEDDLRIARLLLQKAGIPAEQIEMQIRVGIPSDEIIKAARELQVNFIVIGSRGNSFAQSIRRFFSGSTSRRVLRYAPCPVIIANPLPTARPSDLVSWYETAITNYLQQHTQTLTVFTPQEVALQFVPPNKTKPGRKETAAATLALEQLAGSGLLCRHDIKGEYRYVND